MYRAAMDSMGVDTKGSSINRAPESAPADQLNNDRERACMNNLSWIKPQMMRQVLSFREEEKNGFCLGGSPVVMDSCSLGLMKLFPQPVGISASISPAAKHKASACKYTQNTASPGTVQSQRRPFLSHGSVQTNATVSRPASATATAGKPTTAPMTIFYNGTVTVYDIAAHKAEAIMMLATTAVSNLNATSPTSTITPTSGASPSKLISMAVPTETFTGAAAQQQTACKPNAGLPIARKQSLQRFLEKRKERQNSMSPYAMKTPGSNDGFAGAHIVSPTL